MEEQSQKILNLKNLTDALCSASVHRLMSIEHAGAVLKHYLARSGLDAPKEKTQAKGK